jgi:hypothetical protein
VAAPAGFSGAVAIGANANGATPVVPTWTLTVTSLNSDYAAGVINRHATNPFGLRIQFANVSPADSGHDFIHCDANGTTYFQVASSGILSIAGTQVLGPRRTGWGADTGTAKRTANATYSATAEATYTQATIQALMNAVRDLSQTQKAIKDDLISHGIIGP